MKGLDLLKFGKTDFFVMGRIWKKLIKNIIKNPLFIYNFLYTVVSSPKFRKQ